MRKVELQNNESLSYIIEGIWNNIGPRRRYQSLILLFLMILGGIAELLSVSALLPFLTVIAEPGKIYSFSFLAKLLNQLNINSDEKLLTFVLIIFCLFVVFSATLRGLNIFIGTRLIAKISHELSCDVFKRSIYKSYEQHLKSNSSQLITSFTNYILCCVEILYAFLQILTAFTIGTSIIFLLFFIDWKIAISLFLLFGLIYLRLSLFVKSKLTKLSKVIAVQSQRQVSVLQESFSGIRDIILNLRQPYYLNLYKQIDWPIRDGAAKSQIYAVFPKYCIESLSLILIAFLAFFISISETNKIGVIPLVGTFALSAQKIIPSMQQIYASWVGMKQWSSGAGQIIKILDEKFDTPKINYKLKKYNFKNSIEFKNVDFAYSERTPHILKNFNLQIKKGQHIGIIGSTGSGKTTFIDILMGILPPNKGYVLIDGKRIYNSSEKDFLNSWRLNISHVPQNIYLIDGSIADNIAFGIKQKDIDFRKVKKAANSAKISDFIDSTEEGYSTYVGERGIQLSGGQCQRIAIARALYKGSDVLILDEATSALDNKTEKELMLEINKLSRRYTIISVAHRYSTIKNFDRVIKLENGKVIFDGLPNQIE